MNKHLSDARSRQVQYDSLKTQILSCRNCQEEFGYEPHPIVFGHPNSKIMQISQAPSKSVHETYRPFNDASGRRLRGEWYGIKDEIFYMEPQEIDKKPAYVIPHPSPLNMKWFRDHPEFEEIRIKEIAQVIHEILNL